MAAVSARASEKGVPASRHDVGSLNVARLSCVGCVLLGFPALVDSTTLCVGWLALVLLVVLYACFSGVSFTCGSCVKAPAAYFGVAMIAPIGLCLEYLCALS